MHPERSSACLWCAQGAGSAGGQVPNAGGDVGNASPTSASHTVPGADKSRARAQAAVQPVQETQEVVIPQPQQPGPPQPRPQPGPQPAAARPFASAPAAVGPQPAVPQRAQPPALPAFPPQAR
jgi:hypothetical protein